MSGDYSRFSYKPEKRHASVWMQQGRVQLDSDWIEQAELLKRRWETQAADTFGNCAVPRATTPNAFKIGIQAGPPLDLTLGAGRFYAGGKQAELFAGERFNNKSITYLNQPFLPNPSALAVGDDLIVYLDVWDREITYIEDPDLLEKALGGPDTTTRVQTVWQVKVHKVNNPACGFDLATIPGNHASGGQLSTRAIAPPQPDDPCIIAPSGGFRGLENRLYRVEIHSGTTLADAKFKWSRDNASLVSSVTQITNPGGQSVLKVTRLGRDQVLRFKVNDWVEITDDHRELNGQAGEMARIVAPPDEVNLTLTLDRALPGTFNAGDATRHTRVRRWDQQQNVDANGLVSVAGGWLPLEDGVEVQFGMQPAGAQFRIGDYWAFAARTAEAWLETLTQAPPRGIKHHYCQLAAINNLAAGVEPRDCRNLWPHDEGCCTFVVHPGESIQAAIDALPEAGGCVCLKAGIHLITEPILIGPGRKNVHLHGESLGAVVQRNNGLSVLWIIGSTGTSVDPKHNLNNILIESIRFEGRSSEKADPEAALLIAYGGNVTLRDCHIARQGGGRQIGFGAYVFRSAQVNFAGNHLDNFMLGVVGSDVDGFHCARNVLHWRDQESAAPAGLIGFWLLDTKSDFKSDFQHIEQNRIQNYLVGVVVISQEQRGRSVIAGNQITRRDVGLTLPNAPAGLKVYGIMALAPECSILDNELNLPEAETGGILVVGPGCLVAGNRIIGGTRALDNTFPLGILVSKLPPELSDLRPDDTKLIGNTLTGVLAAIVVNEATGVQVLENLIRTDGKAASQFGIVLGNNVQDTVVAGNEVRGSRFGIGLFDSGVGTGNRLRGNLLSDGQWGIMTIGQAFLEISDNVIERMEQFGIWAIFGFDMRCSRNRLTFCGSRGLMPNAPGQNVGGGLLVWLELGETTIEGCDISRTGLAPDGSTWLNGRAFGLALLQVNACRVHSNHVAYPTLNAPQAVLAVEHRALLASRLGAGARAQVEDNSFIGFGFTHLVEFASVNPRDNQGFERLIFSNNACEHATLRNANNPPQATVLLNGQHPLANGNQIKGSEGLPSFNLSNIKNIVVVGNVSGPYIQVASTVPTPHTAFNVII